MNVNQKRDFLIHTAYALVLAGALYLAYKYIFPIIIPFIFGLIVAYMVVKTSRKLNTQNKWIRILIIILFYVIFGILVALIMIKGISFLKDLVALIPTFYETHIAPTIDILYKQMIILINELDPSLYATVEMIWENLFTYLNDAISLISSYVVNVLTGMITAVPTLFISTLMMVISSFFFAIDYENILTFYHKNVEMKWKLKVLDLKMYLVDTLLVVIRSYILIMLLTFSELSILFLLFGIEHPVLIAMVIAIFDIMPVLGSGGILIPWAIISLLTGDFIMGIKLLMIYGIITVVRNYVEPKIVGAQLGLHPIISLVSMFIGLRLFGFIGMFGLPVTISFLWKKRNEKRQVHETL